MDNFRIEMFENNTCFSNFYNLLWYPVKTMCIHTKKRTTEFAAAIFFILRD